VRLYEFDRKDTTEIARYNRRNIRPESTLESWLHIHPELIVDEPLLIIGRQVRVDSGVADLVALDEFGHVAVVEAKIGRSGTGSASEETILSQPQNYASDLSAFDYETLDELYQEYRSKLERGEWDDVQADAPGGSLRSAVETTFGKELAEHEFNTEQRLVVVAEEITRRTAANIRYLLEQGLHFQATEIQRFVSPTSSDERGSILSSSLVVDYELSRVRPKQRGSPTYPELVAPIVERVFPSISSVVRAETVSDVFPDGFDTRGPELHSQHPDHPDGVVYSLAVKPDHGEVTLTIDNLEDDPDVVEQIQSHRDVFTAEGFTVKENTRYRLVEKQWSVESADEVRDRSAEIGEQFSTLVRLGHSVLASSES
jgi:hypothetical protein